MNTGAPQRFKTVKNTGKVGELVVTIDLLRRKVAIIGLNKRIKHLEVDIIARYKESLLLVEVRARTIYKGDPPADIPFDWKKRRAVARWATALLKSSKFKRPHLKGIKRISIYLAIVYIYPARHNTTFKIDYIRLY